MVEHNKDGELYVVLIDFGFSERYITIKGTHISDLDLKETFQGNIIFSSLE